MKKILKKYLQMFQNHISGNEGNINGQDLTYILDNN